MLIIRLSGQTEPALVRGSKCEPVHSSDGNYQPVLSLPPCRFRTAGSALSGTAAEGRLRITAEVIMEQTLSLRAIDRGQSSRLIHRLAARELTPDEVTAIGGGRPAVAEAGSAHTTVAVSCGSTTCSLCCPDDSDA
jgi:hypothetical protein